MQWAIEMRPAISSKPSDGFDQAEAARVAAVVPKEFEEFSYCRDVAKDRDKMGTQCEDNSILSVYSSRASS
jgi:hypothetical protein